MELFLFYFLGGLSVLSSLYFVLARHPLYSILSLIVQIIVYAGAIMVLFLYILMMLNLNKTDESEKSSWMKVLSVFAAGFLLVGILCAYRGIVEHKVENIDIEVGLTKNLGKILFNEYVLPFELASILILSGIVGSVLIGKKDL